MATSPVQPIDFAGLMGPVAHRLLGDPNKAMSKGTRLRWGKKGSMEIDTAEGWFDDHEANERGGVLDLISHKLKCDKAGAFRWLEDEGLKPVSTLPTPSPARQRQSIFYDYQDRNGAVVFRVERRGKGAVPPFLQHGPDGRGGFHAAQGCMQGVRRVPYRLPELLASSPDTIVYLCEGEKDADRLASLGLIATTNPGGAGKFTADLAAHLRGRRVVLLEDNDPAGRNHVQLAEKALAGIAGATTVLKLDGLPAKGDVSDWLDAGNSVDELQAQAERLLAGAAAVDTFPLADLSVWDVTKATPKTFIMPGLVPAGELTLATGAGGANKSTFGQQLATCCAVGRPMLGIEVTQCSALYLTCEDDVGRLHWVQEGICRSVGARIGDLAGKLHLGSLRGRLGNELATFDAEGRLRPSPAFHQLKATIVYTKARLVVLDNAAHLFAGNENDRQQVTAFVNLLYSLCVDLGVTVILVAHTNKAGDTYSGSTAWLNAVRSQIVLSRPENSIDPDERVLSLGKANYARQGEELRFRWHDFALVRDSDLPDDMRAQLAAAAATAGANAAFLECLRARNDQGEGRQVGPSSGPNYAPSQFEGMPQAKGFKKEALKQAMDRLYGLGRIKSETVFDRKAKRDKTIIVEADEASHNPHNARTTPPQHTPTTPHNGGTTGGQHTPIYKYIPGAANGAAAPFPGKGERSNLSRPIFAADDDGLGDDGNVIGWNEGRTKF